MEEKCLKTSVYLNDNVFTDSVEQAIDVDFTLPDYLGEIRRVLHVRQSVMPPAKYVSDGAVELNGIIDYQLLYVGGDGNLWSAPLSSEYSVSVPYDKDVEIVTVDALVGICADGVSTRVSAPRRLSIRSRLRPCVRVLGKIGTQTRDDERPSGDGVFINKRTCQSLEASSVASDIIPIACNVPLEAQDVRVVTADATVCVASCNVL
jgi:hypothetical protein